MDYIFFFISIRRLLTYVCLWYGKSFFSTSIYCQHEYLHIVNFILYIVYCHIIICIHSLFWIFALLNLLSSLLLLFFVFFVHVELFFFYASTLSQISFYVFSFILHKFWLIPMESFQLEYSQEFSNPGEDTAISYRIWGKTCIHLCTFNPWRFISDSCHSVNRDSSLRSTSFTSTDGGGARATSYHLGRINSWLLITHWRSLGCQCSVACFNRDIASADFSIFLI